MAQRTNLRWANVVCQRKANGVAKQNTPLAQCYHSVWVAPWKLSLFCVHTRKYYITEIVNPDRSHLLNRDSYPGLVCIFCVLTSS